MTPARLLLPFALALPLAAQGLFRNADKPGDASCDRVYRDTDQLNRGTQAVTVGATSMPADPGFKGGATPQPTDTTTGGKQGAAVDLATVKVKGGSFYPKGSRRSVAEFAALAENGSSVSLASLKGKTVLVGFWSTRCDPSAKMLLELMDIYPKRERFGFEVLAVNFDENRPEDGVEGGWPVVRRFKVSNPKPFEQSRMPIYLPGLGKQGPANFLPSVDSLPLLCVVDPEGNLASMVIGYEPNFVATQLSRVLRERAAAK